MPSLDAGLYLMTQEVLYDGYVKSVNACAFLTEPNPNPQGTGQITLIFFGAVYRLMDNKFKRITDTGRYFSTISLGDTFGCNMLDIPSEIQAKVLKGDRPGVLIPQQNCVQNFLDLPLTYACSAHVNIVDRTKNCSQSLYFNRTRLEGGNVPDELNAIDGYPMDVFINVDITIGRLLLSCNHGRREG